MFYRWAIRRGHLTADPTVDTDPPRVPRRLPTPVNAGDVKHLIEVLDGEDRLLVMLGALAGLRVSEIANLRGEDVDLEQRRITVRNGKGGNDATVPLANALAAELARWTGRTDERPQLTAVNGANGASGARAPLGQASAVARSGRLFDLPNGQAVAHRIRKAFRRHGITGRPHDLRASFATGLSDASGGNAVLVQQLMRHAEIATTMRYIAVNPAGTDIVDQLFT